MTTKTEVTITQPGQLPAITAEDVRRLLVPPKSFQPTDQEVALFIRYCQDKGLNPFLKQAYLIKTGPDTPAAIVDAIQSWESLADANPNNDGYEAGIIIFKDKALEYRPGSLLLPSERPGIEMVGGFASIFRKDRSHPYKITVSYTEAVVLKNDGLPNRFWAKQPAWQIRNCALRRALKEAFPVEYQGMEAAYSPEDMQDDEIPETFRGTNEERWKMFYAKLSEMGISHDQALDIVAEATGKNCASLKVWVYTHEGGLGKLYEVIVKHVQKKAHEKDVDDLYGKDKSIPQSDSARPGASPSGPPSVSQGPATQVPPPAPVHDQKPLAPGAYAPKHEWPKEMPHFGSWAEFQAFYKAWKIEGSEVIKMAAQIHRGRAFSATTDFASYEEAWAVLVEIATIKGLNIP